MTILNILQYPDSRLHRKGHTVTQIDDRIRRIISDMFETHYATKNCAALAATQLDLANPPHITVIDFSDKKNQPLCLINGEIIGRSGETFEEEGCMSITGIYDKVKRSAHIKVRAIDREGNSLEFEANGFMAKCIQHELDHLNGIIFIDHLSRFKRSRVERKLKKILG